MVTTGGYYGIYLPVVPIRADPDFVFDNTIPNTASIAKCLFKTSDIPPRRPIGV